VVFVVDWRASCKEFRIGGGDLLPRMIRDNVEVVLG
jgi:hypothetical protein